MTKKNLNEAMGFAGLDLPDLHSEGSRVMLAVTRIR